MCSWDTGTGPDRLRITWFRIPRVGKVVAVVQQAKQWPGDEAV
jgi:hypothetical protein